MTEAGFTSSAKDPSDALFAYRQQRLDSFKDWAAAMRKVDLGVGFSELASLVAETWGCSRRNTRRVVSDAHKEWMDIAFGAEASLVVDALLEDITP